MCYNVGMENKARHERDFKGVWIPREVWLSEQLSLMEKVLFVEIHSLDNERGCFASNQYFATFFDISDRQIRNVIGSLKSKGFVTVSVINKNERTIRTAGKWKRISEEELRNLAQMKSEVIHRMSVRGARGVGRKFPGR